MMRKKKIGSVKNELLTKAREAMLSAVQIYNNPLILFKSETFIVLAVIAWTYLLHAYYWSLKIDYRYFSLSNKRKKFDKTKSGAYKHWELERCLNDSNCPIDAISIINLKFLIGLRHEIEHQMTTRIDDFISGKLQASCLNFNYYIKKIFGENWGIDDLLTLSLQFSSFSEEQERIIKGNSNLPKNINTYITGFENSISDEEYNDRKFSFRVQFTRKIVNNRGQADKVIEFIPFNPSDTVVKDTQQVYLKYEEKPKYNPSQVVKIMQEKGFQKFKIHHHTNIWKSMDGKNPSRGYGVIIYKTWYWYESWLKIVEDYCNKNKKDFI